MCYPKPGPRCASAVKKKLAQLNKSLSNPNNADNEETLVSLREERNQALQEYMLTTEGLKKLKARAEETGDEKLMSQYEKYAAERKKLIQKSKEAQNAPFVYTGNNPHTAHAVNSSLSYEGEVPAWFSKFREENSGPFGGKPELIDVIDTPVGKMAVVWEEESSQPQDRFVQVEDGRHINRVTYRSMETGEEQGYMSLVSMSEESTQRAWGNDEWTGIKYWEERRGTSFGLKEWNRENGVKTVTYSVEAASTPEEKEEAKKRVWARTHKAMKTFPASVDRKDLAIVNLKEEHAPNGEQLDAELAPLQKQAITEMKAYRNSNKQPTIDFITLHDSLRGKGLAASLYVYGARKVGEKNLLLKASGIQSDDAQSAWKRMVDKEGLPIRKQKFKRVSGFNPRDVDHVSSYVMDFRKKK